MNILWVEKIKAKFVDVIKEYLFSISVFLLATVFWTIRGDGINHSYIIKTVIPFLETLFYGITPGILLCETIYHYPDYSEKKKTILYAVIIVLTTVSSFFYSSINTIFEAGLQEKLENPAVFSEIAFEVFVCYLVTAMGFAVYFIYKKTGECFETYVAKAFCGLMKALLIYGIIALGVLMVLLIFDTLIVDTSSIDLIMRCEIMIMGLVAYPCALMGISKTEGDFSKFSKVVLSYIFTGLLAIAFLIIYLYIFKIVFTWQFPKNQVFSILTALFCCGLMIWTMAAGCCQEKMLKSIKLMPFLFIPFIILQIMCLYMRVTDYGFTRSRYFGLAMIIFEVIYFAMYIVSYFVAKEITFSLLFLIIAMTYLVLVVPFTNYKSVILMSQKSRIEKYFAAAANGDQLEKKTAYEAYKTINSESGYMGLKYLSKNYTQEQIADLTSGEEDNSESDYIYICASRDLNEIIVEGYKEINVIDSEFYDDEVDALEIKSKDGKQLGTADISDLTSKLLKLDKAGNTDYSKKTELISNNVPLDTGGELIITSIKITGDYGVPDKIEYIEIHGYVLK